MTISFSPEKMIFPNEKFISVGVLPLILSEVFYKLSQNCVMKDYDLWMEDVKLDREKFDSLVKNIEFLSGLNEEDSLIAIKIFAWRIYRLEKLSEFETRKGEMPILEDDEKNRFENFSFWEEQNFSGVKVCFNFSKETNKIIISFKTQYHSENFEF